MTLKPDMTAANAFDEAQAADNSEATAESPATVDNDEGSPSEPTATDTTDAGTKEEGSKELTALLEENGLDIDGLQALVDSDKGLKDLLGDRKIEDVLAKAGKLDDFETQWKKDDESKLRADEDPADTIARLDQKVDDLNNGINADKEARVGREEATNNLAVYDSDIESMVNATDLPDSHKALMKNILSSSHQLQSVDIGNKVDVGKMVKEMATSFQTFSDSVVESYLKGKEEIPLIGSSASPGSTVKGETPTLKEATQRGMALAKKLFRQ